MPSRLTHFLCVPLITPTSRPQLQTSLSFFRSEVASPTPENRAGIPATAVRPPETLHLTLGVMSLLTQDQIDGALSVLRTLDLPTLAGSLPALASPNLPTTGTGGNGERERGKEKEKKEITLQPPAAAAVVKTAGLEITLRGLVSMHDPSQTCILYAAPIDSDGSLHAFCNRLRSIFSDAGFLVQDRRPLLLHATIVNTIYMPRVRDRSGCRRGGTGHGKNRKKMVIDARVVLEAFKEWTWMEGVRLERVAICRMGAQRVRDAEGEETGDEAYVVEGEVEMP